MKIVLPRLQMMLHDRSARVRCSFARLLVGIRDIKSIAVADVVPVSHLHARLVADADTENISSLLVRLLMPTVSAFLRSASIAFVVFRSLILRSNPPFACCFPLCPQYYPQSSRSAVQLERASMLLLSSPRQPSCFFGVCTLSCQCKKFAN